MTSQLQAMRNWRDTADKVVNAGKRVQVSAQAARSALATDRSQLVSCLGHCNAFLALIAEIASEGASSALLGPGIGQTYLVDWEALEPEYDNFRDNLVPGLKTAIEAHEADVVRGSYTSAGYMLDHPLPALASTEIGAALDAVIGAFAAT